MDTRQSESCKFKEIAKFQMLEFFPKLNARHTFWSLLIRCVNMKWVRLVLWKIHSGHDSVHRRTDEQGETSIHPFNFVERGYNKKKVMKWIKQQKMRGIERCVECGKPNTNNWVLDDHNSIMTIHGGYSKLWISKIQRWTYIIEYWHP